MEHDLGINEIRKSSGGRLSWSLVVPGSGSVDVSSASIIIYDPYGVSVATPTAVISGSTVFIDVPANLAFDEGYKAEIEITPSGTSQTQLESVPFDVVYQTWGSPLVGFDDLIGMRSSLSGTLHAQGLHYEPEKNAREMASHFAYLAHVELDYWIRNKSQENGKIRARAILDKTKLAWVEAKLAIAHIFKAKSNGTEDDQNEMNYQKWLADARGSFSALGELRYDIDEDGVADEKFLFANKNIKMTRVYR